MSTFSISAIAVSEVRIRSRRVSTLVVLLAIVVISWLMVPDPDSGMTMMAINDARVLYDSQSLAIAGSTLMSLLLSLAGFYLVRGRMRADLIFGLGAALAATPVTNFRFLLGRWLGAAAHLGLLAGLGMASLLALHVVRSHDPILLHVYLQHFVLIMAPEIVLVASVALLFEAWSLLMGRFGDVLYFILWALMLGLSGMVGSHVTSDLPLALWSDFSGLGTVIYGMHHLEHTTRISIGVASFNAFLVPVRVSGDFWTIQMVLMRFICAIAGLVPLGFATLLFHRFSPDRIAPRMYRSRRSLMAMLNGMLTPLGAIGGPMYAIAIRGPSITSGLFAETGLMISTNPLCVAAIVFALLAGVSTPNRMLPAVLAGTVAAWGVLISDLAGRDYAAGIESITGYLPGGASARYVRQLLSCWLLGSLMVLPIGLRWLMLQPTRGMALIAGLFAVSAFAHLCGTLTKGSRAFTALFLFAIYLSTQIHDVPALDLVGVDGSATIESVTLTGLAGAAAVLVSLLLAAGKR